MIPRTLMRKLKWLRRAAPAGLAQPGVIGPLTGGALLPAFPPLEWTPLAWFALVPLLAALEGEGDPARRRGSWAWFGAGWGMGLVLGAAHYHWIFHALGTVAGVAPGRFIPFWLAWVAALAFGPALAVAACAWARARLGWSLLWTAPLAFMTLDAALSRAPFGGVPWGSWAATQPHTVAAAWLAPVLGGPGVVAVLVLINALWAALLAGPVPARRAAFPAGAALLAALTALLMWPGTPEAGGRAMRALLVPSDLGVPGPEDGPRRLRHYIARTLDFAPASQPASPMNAPPWLIIWPESAADDVTRGKALVEVHDIAALAGGDILLGSDVREAGRDYNSLFLVSAGRFDFQRYDKRELVPFGEYVPAPFRPWFGRKATRGELDYTAGTAPPVLAWQGHRLGVAICFESILPRHVARAVAAGAQVLVVIANDAWLTPPARLHHLRLTALRALEAGRDALFVSNGGWSALLSKGQVIEAAPAAGAPLAVEAGLADGLTLFSRWGITLPLALAALALLARLAGHGLAAFNRARPTHLPAP